MPSKLEDLRVAEVSVVPRGANKQKFLMVKEDHGMDPALVEALKKAGFDVTLPTDRMQAVEKILKDASADEKNKNALMSAFKILQACKGALPPDMMQKLAAAAGYGYPEPSAKDKAPPPEVDPTEPDEDDQQGYPMPAKKADGSWDFSKIPEAARPMLEQLWKDRDSAEQRIAKAEADLAKERDVRLTKEFVEKAAVLKHLGIKSDDLGVVLKEISERAPIAFSKLEPMLKTLDEKIAQSGFLKEIGTSSSGAGDSWTRIEKAAEAEMAKDAKLTKASAIDMVCRKHPEMYHQYKKEKSPVA